MLTEAKDEITASLRSGSQGHFKVSKSVSGSINSAILANKNIS